MLSGDDFVSIKGLDPGTQRSCHICRGSSVSTTIYTFHNTNLTSPIKLTVGINTTLSHHYPTALLVTFEKQVFAGLKTDMHLH